MDRVVTANRLANPVRATLKGILDLGVARGRDRPRLRPGERVDGLTALVTGASSGLGFATTVDLARRGATVLMADCRGLPQAQERARRMCNADRFAALHVDLSDLDSIERLCDELVRREARLDRVILNAAIVPAEIRTTRQGLSELFVVNYLSSFLLLRRLLRAGIVENALFASPGSPRSRRPRIIFVSSEAHRWAVDLDLVDIAKTPGYSLGRVVAVYGYYKLMTTTLAQELDRRLNPPGQLNVPVLSLCPGAMNTGIAREAPRLIKPLIQIVMRLCFQDPFRADEPVLYLACSEEAETRTGIYLHQMVRKAVDPRASDPRAGRSLWERSEALLAELGHA